VFCLSVNIAEKNCVVSARKVAPNASSANTMNTIFITFTRL